MLAEGLQLGRYRLLRLIGRGATSEVYLAEDHRLNRQVALKIVQSEDFTSEEARDAALLFRREAQTIARLNHPNILPLFDFGEEVVEGKTLVYLVMPYCPEGSLARRLRQHSAALVLQSHEVLHFVQQAAEALEYAHEQQLVHRDVKPSNFLVRSRRSTPDHPDLLLADFGIARFTGSTNASKTLRGTPSYMAPEQWSGNPVPATDQYALAIMAYELLTSRPPFLGTQQQVMYQHCMTPPPAPSMVNLRLSPALDAVLLRALEKQPEARFPSVTAFARAFQQAVQPTTASITFSPSSPSSLGTPFTPAVLLPASPSPASTKETPRISLPSGQSHDVYTTLNMSTTEAFTGATRRLTLPGGQQVNVTIPAGAYNGQVLWLKGQIDSSLPNAPRGDLIITLAVTSTVEPVVIETIPGLLSPRLIHKRLLLGGLALLLVLASLVSLFSVGTNLLASRVTQTSVTANQRSAQALQATSTVEPATAAVDVNPYEATYKTLALSEALEKNSTVQWDQTPGSCVFTAAGYQVSSPAQATSAQVCMARKSNFSDLIFEVQMQVLSGSGGGLLVRASDSASYYFRLSPDGHYTLSLCPAAGTFCTTILTSGFSGMMRQGLHQANLLAVVARGKRLELYVNDERIDGVNDSSSLHGQIGVVVEAGSQAIFSQARVWTA